MRSEAGDTSTSQPLLNQADAAIVEDVIGAMPHAETMARNLHVVTAQNSDDDDHSNDEAAMELKNTIFENYLYVVRFFVGPERVMFVVHYGPLKKRCEDFLDLLLDRGAVQRGPLDSKNGVEIADVLVSTFRLFVTYIYTGHILPVPSEDRLRLGEELDFVMQQRAVGNNYRQNWVDDIDLVRLHHFALTYKCHILASDAILLLLAQNERWHRTPSRAAIQYVHDRFDDDSPIHQILAEDVARRLKPSELKPEISQYPPRFVQRLMQAHVNEVELYAKWPAGRSSARQAQLHNYFHPESPQRHCSCAFKRIPAGTEQRLGSDAHSMFKDIVCILVGPEALPFVVHQGAIGKHSKYFRGAFQNGFSETQSATLCLPEEDLAVFCVFLGWLYAREISLPDPCDARKLRLYRQAVQTRLSEDSLRENDSREYQDNDNEANISSSAAIEHARQDASPAESQAPTVQNRPVATPAPVDDNPELEGEDMAPHPAHENQDCRGLKRAASTTGLELEETEKRLRPGHPPPADDRISPPLVDFQATTSYRHRFLLVSLYAFASRRLIPRLANNVIIQIIAASIGGKNRLPLSECPELLRHAFSTLPANSPLCRFIIDEAVWCWHPDVPIVSDRDSLESLPAAFLAAFIQGIFTKTQSVEDDEVAPFLSVEMVCNVYHEHVDDEEWAACQKRIWPLDRRLGSRSTAWYNRSLNIEDLFDGLE